MASFVRYPAVAGRFYPLHPEALRKELRSYLPSNVKTAPALGCIVPHAGYMYSGRIAGAVFSQLELPDRMVVLCPNHTGLGRPISLMSKGVWQTPMGPVPVDSELAAALKSADSGLQEDESAHRAEHAIEVELPFLQMQKSNFSFVPIAIGTGKFLELERLGQAIAEVSRSATNPVLVIASSDMNHYESEAITLVKDHRAIDKILRLDAHGLFETVINEDISMCGFGPAIVMLIAANTLGASKAELVKYATSADVSGDRETVVGYAGIIVR